MKVNPTEVDQVSTKIEERLVIHTTPALIHTALPDGNIDFFNRRWTDSPLRTLPQHFVLGHFRSLPRQKLSPSSSGPEELPPEAKWLGS